VVAPRRVSRKYSSGLYLGSYSRQARSLEQPNKPVAFVVAAGVKYSSSDSNSRLADRQYGHKVDSGQKLFQFPICLLRRRYRAEGAAEDLPGRYFLALSPFGC
jgi:hypothetical protein